MRLYLIRHGETALNVKGCYYGRTDAVLSEKGISQARYLKEILKEVSFDYIVASPLVRAYNTAQIVMEEREQEIFGDRRLMEQDFGIFEGMTYKKSRIPIQKSWMPGTKNFLHTGFQKEKALQMCVAGQKIFLGTFRQEENLREKRCLLWHIRGHLDIFWRRC